MSVAEFPLVSVSGSNPPLIFFEAQTEEFKVSITEYDDGGADYALQAGGSGILRWIINYDGLSLAQVAILRAHVKSAGYDPNNGSAYSFNLRDRETTLITSGVRYSAGGFVLSHVKLTTWSVAILLEKRP
jgi:hypothetical protein